MREFFAAYKNECYKINKKGKIFIVMAVIVGLMLIMTLGFGLINDMIGDYSSSIVDMSREEMQAVIDTQKAIIENYKPNKKVGLVDNTIYKAKAEIVFYQYLLDNNLNMSNIIVPNTLSMNSAGYIETVISLAMGVITIFAVVMACKNLGGEKANGTLKMQALRPVTRKQMLSAKWLSVWSISSLMLIVIVVVAQIVAAIKFGIETKPVVGVLNAKVAVKMPYLTYLTLQMLSNLIKLFCIIQLSHFACSIFWKKGSGLAIVMLLYFLGSGVEQLLGFIYVGYIGFWGNLNFLSAFGVGEAPILKGMNLFSMIAITLLWQVAMMTYNYLHFDKCDIA